MKIVKDKIEIAELKVNKKMTRLNKNLSVERWEKLNFFEQMANTGAEIGRALNWRTKDRQKSDAAFERGLELLDLTIDDKKNHNRGRLKELCRLREILIDYFMFDNIYGSNDEKWNNYFYAFNYAAAINREKSNTEHLISNT